MIKGVEGRSGGKLERERDAKETIYNKLHSILTIFDIS